MKPDSNTEAEDEFWDLGDEEGEEVPLVPTSQAKEPAAEESEEEEPQEESKEEPQEELESDEEEEEPAPTDEEEDLDEDEDEDSESEKDSEEVPAAAGGLKGYFTGALAKLTLVEKVSLLAVLFLLIGAASWGISTFYDNAPEGDLIVFDEKFPVKGSYANIAEVETYWRKPIRSGENADHGVQLKAAMIPCARIVLHGSGTAALALSFRDSELELIGDPISLDVKDGKFSKTGSAEIIITSTAGFENLTEINAYTNHDINPWSLLIVEGAPGTNPSYTEEDKKLAEVRISAESR